ncbi:hypothetical protein ABZ958_14520 [Streptomyces sp. NPDC046237]|uniref:hypothetical protein n=1 Tax=Streptomyces sp. NPDC046237 TaxID=3154914 RepID=UPI0033F4A2EA
MADAPLSRPARSGVVAVRAGETGGVLAGIPSAHAHVREHPMAVIVTVHMPGVTKRQYESVNAKLLASSFWPPEGFISHAGAPADGGWFVVDLWESKEDFEAFVQQAGPIFAEFGDLEFRPTFYGPAARITS